MKADPRQDGSNDDGRSGRDCPSSESAGHGLATVAPDSTSQVMGHDDQRAEVHAASDNLLEAARSHWSRGEWGWLQAIDIGGLRDHPARVELALLIAAGHFQNDNARAAKDIIQLALGWGCTQCLLRRVLISGVHTSLGRASLIVGSPDRAERHFREAITVAVIPDSHAQPLAQARPSLISTQSSSQRRRFGVTVLAAHDLGNAWAGNTINTAIFRHHGIVTHNGLQATAFYVDDRTLRIVQRELATNEIRTHDILGAYNLRDAHNSISLGVDRSGCLHLSYDHHATELRYRRSTQQGSIVQWTDELPMTGHAEDRVTYPTFLLPHHGHPLTLLYRDGIHNKGTARIKTYDETTQTWTDHPQAILSGAENRPWTSNAYWNHPAIGNDGSLHLSFVWRTHTIGEGLRINNINLCYAWSPDNGLTWYTSLNRPYRLPITQVNAESIHCVSPGSNLINQCSMALDSRDLPHIAFYSDDQAGIPQYQHLRFDGTRWHHQFISRRSEAFSLEGHGTLQIPMSRPEIVIDASDNVYVIYRGDLTDNRMVASLLRAPHYGCSPNDTVRLADLDLAFAEPIIDRQRWNGDNVLTLLLQRNEQPNHDSEYILDSQPMTLLDVSLTTEP